MPLLLEQYFLTGRFHATRWNQNAFEDSHGEWPPSPWRLLRALTARWFEHARETGDRNSRLRDSLLTKLAVAPPAFYLPANSQHSSAWPSRGLKQYQPTSLEKSDKKRGEPWVKRAQTTLAVDSFAIVPPNTSLLWIWQNVTFNDSPDELSLLDQLLRRVTYFGRAESLSLIRRLRSDAGIPVPNCELRSQPADTSPVLVADPDHPLKIEVLLANTDDRLLKGRRIPPGTAWWHARKPPEPVIGSISQARVTPQLSIMQFAIGGRVFPPQESWIRITERFRGKVLRSLSELLTNRRGARFSDLPAEKQAQFCLLTGKSAPDRALRGHHTHIRFLVLPGDTRNPNRLICYRDTPFEAVEQEAFLRASKQALAWQYGNADWRLRLVPLPDGTAVPRNCLGTAPIWETITPYVPSRHVLGRHGHPKPGHSVEAQVRNDLASIGLPEAIVVVDETSRNWVKVHRPRRSRDGQTNDLKLGYRVRIQFASSVTGPIALGHSSHFGLGLFAPADSPEDSNSTEPKGEV